jgi:hypothetical protein
MSIPSVLGVDHIANHGHEDADLLLSFQSLWWSHPIFEVGLLDSELEAPELPARMPHSSFRQDLSKIWLNS